MMNETLDMFKIIVPLVLANGAASAAAVKWMLNGTKDTVRRVEHKVDKLDVRIDETREELAHLKGELKARRTPARKSK
jgi:hypothetical protein